jgi:hypothetical protein
MNLVIPAAACGSSILQWVAGNIQGYQWLDAEERGPEVAKPSRMAAVTCLRRCLRHVAESVR